MRFEQLCGASNLRSGEPLRFLRRHPSPDVFLGEHAEVQLQFLLQIAIVIAAAKDSAHPGKHAV
jgi:hypothetical protein